MPTTTPTSKLITPGTALVGLAFYEAFANVLNDSTGSRVLPSFGHFVETRSWARLRRRVFPEWAPTATFAAAGFAISTIQTARKRQRAAAKRG